MKIPFLACVSLAGVSVLGNAAIIDLSRPVDESISPNGIYWTYDSASGVAPDQTTPDSSGNGYTGSLVVGLNNGSPVNAPTLATGVSVPGTSGYGDAVNVISKNGTPSYTANMNPSVRFQGSNGTPGSSYAFTMGDTDFTGGTWMYMDDSSLNVTSGAYRSMTIMTSGNWFTNTPYWTLYLEKTNMNVWNLGFSAGDGTTFNSGSVATGVTGLNFFTDEWVHLGFNFDDSSNTVSFWINGELLATTLSLTNGVGTPGTGADTYVQKTFRVGESVTSAFYNSIGFSGAFDDTFVTTGIHSFAAVPEPSTWALGILGGAAVMLLLRRSRV